MSDETLRAGDTWEGARSEGPGSQIGPYRILRRIGEGGFGVVFEAEQKEPVKRRVALKVIKLGMDTEEVIARFEAERQALAIMNHPNIARVLDAGATASGRPYFVMELVDGTPISEYCDEHRLDIEARLELFALVCTAVQHAHTKGIIHRDLKPSNVLVGTLDGKPAPKVIDFGIAKATSGRLTDLSLHTGLNQVMGTPLYMSPEQAAGSADIDTRTDVYSLGVMLYELLTGTTPVQRDSLRSAVLAEIQRLVCEVEPPPPSTRLAQSATTLGAVAGQRASDPGRLTRAVRGELDWIVMKAIEKPRERRYETANGLAMDLRRLLASEPVLAAPPSASYRLQKFVHRHRAMVAAASLVAASLLVGLAAFVHQSRLTEQRAAELEQVASFQADMLSGVDPTVAGQLLSRDVHRQFAAALQQTGVADPELSRRADAFSADWQQVNSTDAAAALIDRTILKPAIKTIDRKFKHQPVVDARLRQSLAELYLGIGLFDAGEPLARQALATRRRILGEDAPDTLQSLNKLGEILQNQGKLPEAEAIYRDALARRRRTLGDENRDTIASLSDLAATLGERGKFEEGIKLGREALKRSRRVLGNDDPDSVNSLGNLASILSEAGEFDQSEVLTREFVAANRRLKGPDTPEVLLATSDLVVQLQVHGKSAEAEKLARQLLVDQRRVAGNEDRGTLQVLGNLGSILQSQGKLDEAEACYREALDKQRRVFGNQHPDTLLSVNNMGMLLREQGKLPEAEAYLREVVDTSARMLGPGHPQAVRSSVNLAAMLLAAQKVADGEKLLRQTLATSREELGDANPDTLIALRLLAKALEMQDGHVEAARLLGPAEGNTRKAFAETDARRVGYFLLTLGQARTGLGEFAAAENNLLEAQSIVLAARGPGHPETRECMQALAELYLAWEDAPAAVDRATKAAEWSRKVRVMDEAKSASAPR